MGTETLTAVHETLHLNYIDKAPQRWGRKLLMSFNSSYFMLYR